MHSYSTDSSERKSIFIGLALLSVGAALLLSETVGSIPWWIDTPSVLGFYGIFYKVFDKYLWRITLLRRIGLVKIPDLRGVWVGKIHSSFDDQAEAYDATMHVCQSWSRISISMETGTSSSHSLACMVLTENQNAVEISYEYQNEPKPNTKSTMHIHRGTTRLRLSSDRKKLTGEYYTGRDRQNYGGLEFSALKAK